MSVKAEHTCIRCGQCCFAFGITLSLDDMNHEPRLWEYAIPIQQVNNPKTRKFMAENQMPFVIKMNGKGKKCPFLVGQVGHVSCLIYETRPEICRQYPQDGARCIRQENESCQRLRA